MEKNEISDAEAAEMYFAEIVNLLQKANDPLRLAIMLLSMAVKLGEPVPPIVTQRVTHNNALCNRMHLMCLPVADKGDMN